MATKKILTNFDFNKNQLLKTRVENLTSLQIATLSNSLTVNDKGLIVYDTVLSKLIIWNGTVFSAITSTIPTLQQVSEQGDNSTIRLKFNGTDYAVITDIPSPLTNEQIQDITFNILRNTPTISFNYNDTLNEVSAEVIDNSVTNSKLAQVATATFKGRATTDIGNVEDLTVAQVKTLLNLANTNTGDQTITLTNDVVGSGTGSFSTTIAANVVTNSKLAQMAANTVKVNNTNASGNAIDLPLPINTLLGRNNGDIEAIQTQNIIIEELTLIGGTVTYNNPVLNLNSRCIGYCYTGVGSNSSVPIIATPANGSMTFNTGQLGDTATFVAQIIVNL